MLYNYYHITFILFSDTLGYKGSGNNVDNNDNNSDQPSNERVERDIGDYTKPF